jgi:RHS repeat-associated protein
MKAGGQYYFYHNDHLGTPQKITNASGAIGWSATYDAFGKATVGANSTVTNNLRFPGQYYDQETGLHYNWNRFYDPKTGRYTTADPIGLEGGVNLFAYVENEPINWIDADGLNRRSGGSNSGGRYRPLGPRNPYAEMEYRSLEREIKSIDRNFSVIRNENRRMSIF